MSLQFLCEGGAIHALEEVFPPFAPQWDAALPAAAAAVAFHAGHFGGGDARRVALLLTDHFSNDLPLAEILSVTVVSAIVGITFTVGFPMLRNLTLPMVAFQNPAGVRGIVLLVTVRACVAFHALTGVSNVGCHALPMQTLVVKTWVSNFLVTQGARPAGVTLTNHTRFFQGSANAVLADVTGFTARKDSYRLLW